MFSFFVPFILVPGPSSMEGLGDLEQGTEHHSDGRVGGMDDLFMSMQPGPTVRNGKNAEFVCTFFVLLIFFFSGDGAEAEEDEGEQPCENSGEESNWARGD
jgi:hypothetical protein